MKRSPVLLTLLLLATLSFGAGAQVVITHFTNIHHGVDYHEWIRRQAEAFNASQSDVEVQIIVGNATNLATMMAAGVPPHISDIHLYINPIGFRVDLLPFMERDGVLQLIHPGVLESAYAADGGIYQAPLEVAAQPTYFNRNLFHEAGLPAPDELGDNWDWDAVISSGKRLTVDTDGDGIPNTFGVDRPWGGWRTAVAQAGGTFYEFDDVGTPIRSLWNSAEVEAGVDFINRIYREGITASYVVPNERSYDVYSGLSAVTLTDGMSGIGRMVDASFDWDVYLQPRGPAGPYASVGVSGPQILHDENVEASWAWLRYYVFRAESQVEFVLATGRLPSLREVQEEYAGLMKIGDKNFRAILEQSVLGSPHRNFGLPDDLHPRTFDMNPIWRGHAPVRPYLENIHNVVSARLQAYGL